MVLGEDKGFRPPADGGNGLGPWDSSTVLLGSPWQAFLGSEGEGRLAVRSEANGEAKLGALLDVLRDRVLVAARQGWRPWLGGQLLMVRVPADLGAVRLAEPSLREGLESRSVCPLQLVLPLLRRGDVPNVDGEVVKVGLALQGARVVVSVCL